MSDNRKLYESALRRTAVTSPKNIISPNNIYANYAISRGITVDQAREDHLQELALRKKSELEGTKAKQQQERQLRILAGESPEQVNKEVAIAEHNASTMSGTQRLQNVMNGGYDPEFSRDLDNKSPEELGMLYGAEVQAFATQRAQNELSSMATTFSNRGKEGSALGAVIQGIGQGTANLLNTANTAIHQGISSYVEALEDSLTSNESYDSALKRRKAQGWRAHNKNQESIDSFFGQFYSEAQANEKKSDAAVGQLAEALRLRKEREYRNEVGIDWDNARKAAAEDADTLDNYGKNISKEKVFTGIGEQVPQLALAYVTGGAGNALASKGALVLGEKAITKLGANGLAKAGSIGASVGIGAEAGAQDYVGAGADAYSEVMQLPQEALDKSPNYQKLVASGMSDKEARETLAVEAAGKAGTKSGLITAASAGALGSVFEKTLFSLGGKLTKNNALLGLSSPVTEAASEGLEEYWNVRAPKEAVNDTLGYAYHADPSIYSTSAATQAAAIAGLVGGAASVKSSGSLVKHGASAAFDALKNTKLGEKAAEKFNKSSADREEDVSAVAAAFETFHKEDSSALIKSMIKKYAADNNMKEEDLSTKDYENFSKVVRATYEKAKAEGNTDEVQRFEDFFREVRKAAFSDLEKIYTKLELRDGKAISKMIDELQSPNTSEERKAELNTVIADAVRTYKRAANIAQVLQSNFMRNFSEDKQASPEDDNINLEDFLGQKPQNLTDILFSADKIKDAMDANSEKASAIFKKWVSTIVGSISQDDITADILHNIKAPVMDMLKHLRRADFSQNAYTKASIQAIQKIFRDIPENLNDKTAKTIYGKWLDPNKGVLAYLDRLGKTNDAFARLTRFRKTQADKVNALSNMILEQSNNVDKNGQYLTPQTVTLPDGELLKRQDSDLPVEFNSVKEANAYLNKILHEEDAFNKIMRDVTITLARAAKKDDAKAKAKSKAKPKQDNTTSKDSTESFSEEDILNGKTTEEKTESKTEEPETATKGESKTEEKVKEESKAKESEENFEEVKEESEPIIAENKTETKATEQSSTKSTEEVEEKTEETTAKDKTKETTAKSRQDEQEDVSKEQTKETPNTEEKLSKIEAKAEEKAEPSKEAKTESKESKVEPSKDIAQDAVDVANKFSKVGIEVNNVTFNGKEEADSIYKGAIWSGGAKGADRVWAAMLNEAGVSNKRIYHFNLNNKDSLDNAIGTNLGLIPDDRLATSIRNALAKRIAQGGENFNNKRFISKVERHIKDLKTALAIQDKRIREKEVFKKALVARNILQILWSNGVVAAAPATGKIQSETMTAIILATYANLPVLILDTNSQDGSSWYSIKGYNYNNGNGYYNMEKVSDPITFFDAFIKNGRSGDGLTFVGSRNTLMNSPNIRTSMVDYVAKTFNGDAKAIDEAFIRTMTNDGLMNESSEAPSTEEVVSDHANVSPVENVTPRERADFRQDTKDAFFDAIKDKSKEEQQKIIAAAVTNGYFPEGDSVFSRYMNKSMNQYENVSKILDGSEDITEEMKADALIEFNPSLSKEAATQYVKDSPKEVDEIFEKIKSVVDIVQDRYAKGKLNIDEKTIVNPSAVLDLYGKDNNSNVVIPKHFMIALALGFIDAINHGLSGNAEMSDDFRENIRLNNKSTYNNKYNPVVLNRTDGKGDARPDEKALKDNELN